MKVQSSCWWIITSLFWQCSSVYFFLFYTNLFVQAMEFRVLPSFQIFAPILARSEQFSLLIIIPTGKMNTFPRMLWSPLWWSVTVVLEAKLHNRYFPAVVFFLVCLILMQEDVKQILKQRTLCSLAYLSIIILSTSVFISEEVRLPEVLFLLKKLRLA